MTKYIKSPIPKTKKGAKKMSDKKALTLPAEKGPRTLNIRVKTLVIVITLLLSHGLVFYAGAKTPGVYNDWLDRVAAERSAKAAPSATAEATESDATPSQLKADQ